MTNWLKAYSTSPASAQTDLLTRKRGSAEGADQEEDGTARSAARSTGERKRTA